LALTRKVVTVLFCDVTGSTALGESVDPEALRELLARYFERMSGIVESHGGTVEKFIGDAVMAVFGIPVAHEDDALRAVRAAGEMRDALPELGVEARIGVNTGEVVTGTEERLATGDAVNVAARLEQAAAPGEVLLGSETLRLVQDAVEAEPVEPLELKGKSEPVAAFRLIGAGQAPERPHGETFVGRGRELDLIFDAWTRAAVEQRCELVTVVAEAGVGKSRLAAEALSHLDAKVVRGRCLSYGEGVTYWPVVEVVKQLGAVPSDPAAAAAIASLLGETDSGTSAEEIAWAFRKLLEEQAPVVCVFEDLHWGEETFLDLVEHVALLSSGAQVMLVCTARPELLDRRPAWPVALRLAPLSRDEVDRLLPPSLQPELRERIAHAAGGNPLFVTEMVAMAGAGDGEVEVPPTLRALLTARLDQVDASERRVLERGAVEGEIFHRGAVQALAPDEPQVTARLASLVRRELVRPDRAQVPGEDGFRFRHLLIRDAAYDALPKSERAQLHAQFADWLEQHGATLVELDEILGHHLERAALYRAELGRPDRGLAERAGERLATAGRRALWRGDPRAAAGLLARALQLTRPYRVDVALELDLVSTLPPTVGRRKAAEAADAVAERAREAGNRPGVSLARAVAALHRIHVSVDPQVDLLEKLATEALEQLDGERDHAELIHLWFVFGYGIANFHGRFEDAARADEQALRHARLAGYRQWRPGTLVMALVVGPRPADEGLRTLDVLMPEDSNPGTDLTRAWLLTMLGNLEEGWRLGVEASRRLSDLHGEDTGSPPLAEIAVLAGDPTTGVNEMRTFCDYLERRGELGHLSYYGPRLGRMLCTLGRHDEAEPLAQRGRELTAAGDRVAETAWRQAQALVDSHRGRHAEAETLAREAVAYAQRTDAFDLQGDRSATSPRC
jgi:class 3 adenylate cyclase